mgnify:CR=1 FL=1
MPPQPNLKLAILALGLGAFAIGTSEFAAMGLLPWYASDLGITEPQAGQAVCGRCFSRQAALAPVVSAASDAPVASAVMWPAAQVALARAASVAPAA